MKTALQQDTTKEEPDIQEPRVGDPPPPAGHRMELQEPPRLYRPKREPHGILCGDGWGD